MRSRVRGLPLAVACGFALAVVLLGPLVIAAANPLQASRGVAYVTGSLAGVAALALLVVQPLLAAGYLPGLRLSTSRRWHRWIGGALVLAVAAHVGGLYLASPQDAMDALLLVAPTPFSVYGVTAMWAVVLTALLVTVRARFVRYMAAWRIVHNALAVVVVAATVVHALMIEGTMGAASKLLLCLLALVTTLGVVAYLRIVKPLLRAR